MERISDGGKMKVYLIIGNIDYEGADVLCVVSDKEKADSTLIELEKYSKNEPVEQWRPYGDVASYNKYIDEVELYNKNAPMYYDEVYDVYSIKEFELI